MTRSTPPSSATSPPRGICGSGLVDAVAAGLRIRRNPPQRPHRQRHQALSHRPRSRRLSTNPTFASSSSPRPPSPRDSACSSSASAPTHPISTPSISPAHSATTCKSSPPSASASSKLRTLSSTPPATPLSAAQNCFCSPNRTPAPAHPAHQPRRRSRLSGRVRQLHDLPRAFVAPVFDRLSCASPSAAAEFLRLCVGLQASPPVHPPRSSCYRLPLFLKEYASPSMPHPAIKFGTDGWRGVIADDFTFANVRTAAEAIAAYIHSRNDRPGRSRQRPLHRLRHALRLQSLCPCLR